MSSHIEVLVIGAGVVGLAVARALAQRGHEVIVVERHRQAGLETSSRNSGVIHSGIYYEPGSLKARLCVAGRQALYAYCADRGIEHRRCGKLIVAQHAQLEELTRLHRRAMANGVDDLTLLDAGQVRALEPELHCAAGLLCPSTGILDVHGFLRSLQGDVEAQGGVVAFGSGFDSARRSPAGLQVQIISGGQPDEVQCRWLINCAGLSAFALMSRIEDYPEGLRRPGWFAKGSYFSCPGVRPFRHLVYPMPDAAGLGIHATLDLDGSIRFGPDVEWVEAPEYSVDPGRSGGFYLAIREYWPGLPDGALQPAYAGVRPKGAPPGSPSADFRIECEADHGVPGLIGLLGIESPGFTASLALADAIADRLCTPTPRMQPGPPGRSAPS